MRCGKSECGGLARNCSTNLPFLFNPDCLRVDSQQPSAQCARIAAIININSIPNYNNSLLITLPGSAGNWQYCDTKRLKYTLPHHALLGKKCINNPFFGGFSDISLGYAVASI